ncbi:transposase [Bifidobacterium animalis]|uniref:transposase n=1 Tax=Bifidobacterium animalis TaxID=28025 RepID=UPI003B75C5B9
MAPNRLHVADITYVRMTDGRFGYAAFVTDVFARRIGGMGVRHQHEHRGAAPAGAGAGDLLAAGTAAPGAHPPLDHGSQYISTVYTTRVREYGMLPSTGTVGDSYDNAMAESVNGAYKTELVWRRKPFRDVGDLELATFQWVSWWNSKRLHASLDYRTPEQVNRVLYEPGDTSRLTIKAEQNQTSSGVCLT